jgi:capsular exopolysaccharide synthesis family protein
MSNLFDALQRAERESSGRESSSVATELLQLAELKIREASSTVELPSPADEREVNPSPSVGDDIERCPVLSISISKASRLVSAMPDGGLAAEKFRFLAVRLRQMRQTRPLKKLLVTSSIPEEGKSTVSANLACTLARRGQKRVILVEGDLRRPTLTEQFGIGRIPGLSECLAGGRESINIYKLEPLGLWILPAGTAAQNPLELLQSQNLPRLMDSLEARFDWIVIDSPPVLPLADTSIWGRLSDGILLVTRPGITEKKQLQRGIEALEAKKLVGALVNASSDVAHSDYYQRYTSSNPSPAPSNSQKPSSN